MKAERTFVVKDCTLVQLSTGIRAQSLKDLREGIASVESSCIYYHFWGNKMAPSFEEQEYNNDFATWVAKELNDVVLAEKLSVVDPSQFASLEELREELLDVIDQRLDELDYPPVAKYDRQFHFIKGFVVVFDTYRRVEHPKDMCLEIPKMSTGSVFYHFVDARRRNPEGLDDFRSWLLSFGEDYIELVRRIAEIDPFFKKMSEVKEELTRMFREYFMET